MKKNMKSILAKGMALAMAFSLMAVAPGTQSEAAKAKKPTIKKKVSIAKGKSKTIKVTSKKKVKKTKWSLDKKGKKVVKLSKKKAKSVKVKALKKGKAKLTAKVKVGKKTYKLKSTITVTAATTGTDGSKKPSNSPSAAPSGNPSTTQPSGNPSTTQPSGNPGTTQPSSDPYANRVHSFTADGTTLTVDESATYNVPLTELNETTFTCDSKRPEGSDPVRDEILYGRDGSVSFVSNGNYNSGVTFYVNPCTSEDDIIDISDKRGTGYLGYENGTKDMSAYDYIRIDLTSTNEMNFRTYNGNDQLETAGFPGSASSETYEGGWKASVSDYMENVEGATGMMVKEGFERRTVFISLAELLEKGCNPATLTAFGICPQGEGMEVTIHSVDFVKVKYDTPVTGITVTADKTEIVAGRTATLTAAITPENATRKMVTWESDNPDVAQVNFKGVVTTTEEKTGEATITAKATDGSNVTGSIKVTVTDASAAPKAETIKVDLKDSTLVAKSSHGQSYGNPGEVLDDGCISFGKTGSSCYLDMSEYFKKNNIDLANYKTLSVTYEVRDDKGTKISEWPSDFTAGWGKTVHWVNKTDLNGYTEGLASTGGGGSTAAVSATSVLTVADADPAKLAEVAGFNLQFNAIPENYIVVVTDITFSVD